MTRLSPTEHERLVEILGGLYGHDPDPRIDLPLVDQVRALVRWACSTRPDNFRRSIPNDPHDHDHLLLGALVKLVRAAEPLRKSGTRAAVNEVADGDGPMKDAVDLLNDQIEYLKSLLADLLTDCENWGCAPNERYAEALR